MNNITVVGSGYVGLVTGACFSQFGMNVVCVDVDKEKIAKINSGFLPIYEQGLDDIVKNNIKSGRLRFTTDLKEAVNQSEVIFIAVGTPPMEDGSADLSHVLKVAADIAVLMKEYKVIVTKSTVPVGTARLVKKVVTEELLRLRKKVEFDIVSNPEFLREGAAVRDFTHPDRIIIGAESEKAKEIMQRIYHVLYLIEVPFIITNFETAEIIKYASNAFLATKISFINEIANLCDEVGADVHKVSKAMGMDGRIGSKFLHPGPGFGGSCFPKDIEALLRIFENNGMEMKIVQAVTEVNKLQRVRMLDKIKNAMGDLQGLKFGVLGLSFKPETDDIRESPAIDIVKGLLASKASVRLFDPIAMENAKKTGVEGDNILYCRDEYQCATGVDGLLILTEWNQFRNLDLSRIKGSMKQSYFFDFRNIYEPELVQRFGFHYSSVGRR